MGNEFLPPILTPGDVYLIVNQSLDDGTFTGREVQELLQEQATKTYDRVRETENIAFTEEEEARFRVEGADKLKCEIRSKLGLDS